MASSPAIPAQSQIKPKANAVWACSPMRIGSVSLGSQVRMRSAAARSSGSRVFDHSAAWGSSHSRSSAASWSSQARPYGRSKETRPSPWR